MSKYLDLASLINVEFNTQSILDLCEDEDILYEFQLRANESFLKDYIVNYCNSDDRAVIKDILESLIVN